MNLGRAHIWIRGGLLAAAGTGLSGCLTTDEPQNPDPYGGYGQSGYGSYGGYGAGESDYVQVTPLGQQGQGGAGYGNAQGNDYSQPGGGYGAQGGYPTQPAPSYGSGGGGSGYSGGGGGTSYTVQQGDTLYRISRIHNTSVSAIKAANGLTSDLIRPGDVLTIP